jgi:hypothetical protein
MVRIIPRNIGNYQSTLLNIPEQRRSRGQKIWDTWAYKNYSGIKMQLIKYTFANNIHLAQDRSTVMNLWVLVKGENSALAVMLDNPCKISVFEIPS